MAYDPSNPDYNDYSASYTQQPPQFYPSDQQMFHQHPQHPQHPQQFQSPEIMKLKMGLDMANARIESLITILEQMKEQNQQLICTNQNLSDTNKNLLEQNENSQLCVSMLSQLLKSVNEIKSHSTPSTPSDLRFTKKSSACDKTSESLLSPNDTSSPVGTSTKKPSSSPPSLKRPQSTTSSTVIKKTTSTDNSSVIKKTTTTQPTTSTALKRNITNTTQNPPKLRKVVDKDDD